MLPGLTSRLHHPCPAPHLSAAQQPPRPQQQRSVAPICGSAWQSWHPAGAGCCGPAAGERKRACSGAGEQGACSRNGGASRHAASRLQPACRSSNQNPSQPRMQMLAYTHPMSASASARRLRALPLALKEGAAQPAASNSSSWCSAIAPAPPAAAGWRNSSPSCAAAALAPSGCCCCCRLPSISCACLLPQALGALLPVPSPAALPPPPPVPPGPLLLGPSNSCSSSERSTKRATLPQSTPRSISSGSSRRSCGRESRGLKAPWCTGKAEG